MAQLSLFDIPVKKEPVVTKTRAGSEKGKLLLLPLTGLIPDPDQPRKFFDEQALAELRVSIVSHGVLQPILVREAGGGKFHIVSGERRYQASRQAGLATIPAIITDGEPAEIAIIENLLRENLTAIEEAEAIERLRSLHDYRLSDLSAIIGKAESTISEILSLNRLPAEVKDDCRNNPKAVRSILKLVARQKTPEKMLAQYRKYREKGTVWGEIIPRPAKPKTSPGRLTPKDLATLSERLDMLLADGLTQEEKAAFLPELTKLRSVAYSKIRQFKGERTDDI